MALLNSTVGLIYSIKADSSETQKEVSELRKHIDKETKQIEENGSNAFLSVGKAVGLSDEQITKLATTLPAVGTIFLGVTSAITITIAAVAAATAKLYEFTSQASATGTEIANFQKLTGLTAESISAIKIASDSAGTSLDEFEEVWESFIELLIEGAKGAEDAKDKLMSAGIDPQKGFNDLEGSVQKAFDAIRNAQTQAEKSAIAMNVFGESGLNMVKVADEMTGGFDAYKQKLQELGLTMDADGIRKAKEFDRETKQLKLQIEGLKNLIGFEFMPVFLSMTKAVSGFFKENKESVKTWANELSTKIQGLIAYWKELNQWAARYKLVTENPPENSWSKWFEDIDRFIFGDKAVELNKKNPIFNPTWQIGKDTGQKVFNKGVEVQQNNPDIIGNSSEFIFDATKFTDLEKERQAAEQARKEREERARRDTAALLAIWKQYAEDYTQIFEKTYTKAVESFGKTGNAGQFRGEVSEAVRIYIEEMTKADAKISELTSKQLKEQKATENERKLAEKELTDSKNAWIARYQEKNTEVENRITENQKKESEKRVKVSEDEANQKIALIRSAADLAISERQRDLENDLKLREANRNALNQFSDSMLLSIPDITETERAAGVMFDNLEKMLNRRLLNEITTAEAINQIKLEALENEKAAIQEIVQTDENRANIQLRLKLLDNEIAKQKIENETRTKEATEKMLDREQKTVDLLMQNLEVRQQIEEKIKNQPLPEPSARPGYDANGNETTKAPVSVFDSWKENWHTFIKQIEQDSVGVGNVLGQMGSLFIQFFDNLANATGKAIENWALYGGSVGKALKQALAAELAHIAGVATVKALYATALGFMRLAELNFPAAGNAFLSAGLWAALAGGTALAARALSGNQRAESAFSSATSTNAASSANSGGGTGNGARAYSSYGDKVTTIENDRNQPMRGELTLKLDSNGVIQVLENDLRNNGRFRNLIIKTVEGY